MTDAEQLQAALTQRCLDGLVETARALAGDDPTEVCAAFEVWQRSQARRSWPWLPGLCFTALEPLGVEFPVDDDAAVTLGRLIVGAETDPEAVRDALDALAAAPRSPRPATGGSDLALQVRRRTLETAVDRFWQELRTAAERLREPVARRDRPRADAILVAARRQLEETAERVETLAGRARAHLDARATEPPQDPSATAEHPQDPSATAEHPQDPSATAELPPAVPPAPAAPPAPPDRAPAAPAPAAPAPAEQDDEWEGDRFAGDDVEYRTVRERRLAPLVFLAGVTLGALVWLLVIAADRG